MTPTPRKDDPAAIKAACAAISDAWPRGTQGGGPQNLAAIDRLATTIAGAEWFPKPSTTLDGLRFILERVEAWKASPRFKACAAGGVKLPGWNTWIRTSLDEAQPLPWDDAPAVEFKSKAGLGTGKTAAETGVKTL